jgi:hypothetical protein
MFFKIILTDIWAYFKNIIQHKKYVESEKKKKKINYFFIFLFLKKKMMDTTSKYLC